MIVTKYSEGNFLWLLIGVGVALADLLWAAMTSAFGADRVHDLRSGVVMAGLYLSLLLLPASLITFKWPRVGAIVSWAVVALCCGCLWADSGFIFFLSLAAVEALIATMISKRSVGTTDDDCV